MAILFFLPGKPIAQRIYHTNSVLNSGNWYKIAVKDPGVYKIDIPFLNRMGINTNNLASNSIRLYGNGGQMLPEANALSRIDDLQENAILTADGGDGILNGNDYILFYAPGPDQWVKDSLDSKFSHKKNLYSDSSYYFLTIGGSGKRIQNTINNFSPNITVTSFSERYFHELDTVNFLTSGKKWYGEEFENAPGKSLTRSFDVTIPGIQTNFPLTLVSNCIARSVGGGSNFDVRINNQPAGQIVVLPVTGATLDLFAQQSMAVMATNVAQPNVVVQYNYNPGSFNAQGWLDWFELFCRRNLSFSGSDQVLFRDWQSVGNNVGEFIISNATAAARVWDITDPLTPVQMQTNMVNTDLHFVNDCSKLREYVAFNSSNFLTPTPVGNVPNQNLHNSSPVDLLIITYPAFLLQAQRLAQFHQQKEKLRVLVVTTDQVYNEFGSGSPDPVTVRDFVKMYYDKYKNTTAGNIKYLLLFGAASYDYKYRLKNNTNYVPAYESDISLDPLSTYTSDDFYGFLDDDEDINSGTIAGNLDIGIGRVPAVSNGDAKSFVDKVITYTGSQSFGPWRNNMLFIADDGDNDLHLQDAEVITGTVGSVTPVFDLQKIYLDAYKKESGAGGSSYPQVNEAINNQVFNGTLIWNYNGHGGARRLADETILDQSIINSWKNPNKLPLFITATCDFAPYDNPGVNSIGVNLLVRPATGGIALMTTTRAVYASSNRIMNNNYLQISLQADANGKYKTLGDAVRDAKNYTYQVSADIVNNRKFTLLGDPALTLAFPKLNVVATKINGKPIAQTDTLKATDKVIIDGEVRDKQATLLAGFNGIAYLTVFDKPRQVTTLGNDPASPVTTFSDQSSVLFKGKASVSNGKFSFSFKMPKDINYQYGSGKLSLYAHDSLDDANGFSTHFLVGGNSNNPDNDKQGPQIKAWMNDEKFVNGGIVNQTPVLIIKLSDSSGINTTGTGIGHDIVATLDNDNKKFFVLNDFYQSDLNSYQQGSIRFQLPGMDPGPHSLKIKAWDVLNNSSEYVIEFTVANDDELQISHVLNYPNPFTTNTSFWFEHNKPGQDLHVRVAIFTLTGRIINVLQKTINTPGDRSSEVQWDGKDEFGSKVGRGVYLYKLSVTVPGLKTKEKIEKLVVF
ncbi:MAG: type IX secretion system sortase PorU [Chitinophagaceae bacterium]|nr:type IX secretion system sortase PorU [Chitinophagaceae bacterium]